MIKQWLEHFKMTRPIECTSLITRLASRLGALKNVKLAYIPEPRVSIDESDLVQGYILKHALDDSLVFFYTGYTNEIPMPNPGYRLYKCRELTLPLQEEKAHRSSVSRRLTRSQTVRSRRAPPQRVPPPPSPSPEESARSEERRVGKECRL